VISSRSITLLQHQPRVLDFQIRVLSKITKLYNNVESSCCHFVIFVSTTQRQRAHVTSALDFSSAELP